eukprot:scaffold20245_cov94-Skeletonema_dohrnii-CCMP3373.AAC.1
MPSGEADADQQRNRNGKVLLKLSLGNSSSDVFLVGPEEAKQVLCMHRRRYHWCKNSQKIS